MYVYREEEREEVECIKRYFRSLFFALTHQQEYAYIFAQNNNLQGSSSPIYIATDHY